MKIKFPTNCNTEASRMSFAHRADEVLRLEHNVMGAKFRNGEITELQWDNYLKAFEAKSKGVHKSLNEQIEIARHGTFWKVDLARDIIDG